MTVRNSRTSTRIHLVLSLSLVAACGDKSGGNDDDDDPIVIEQNNGSTNSNANNGATNNGVDPNNGMTTGNNGNNGINANCPPEARPVYVVEADEGNPLGQGKLVRFDPKERAFTEIGELDCPAAPTGQPFSMSVDRDATAWVLYSTGELFEVSTSDASCQSTTFAEGQSGYDVFGMGFVLNTPNTEDETLYVAGGSGPGDGVPPRIGYITFPDLALRDVAEIGGWPEMSGTAAAELWAFFPNPVSGTARVSRIVPATGEEVETIPVDALITGDPNAWAFAHWGGNFYMFYKSQTDPSTSVFEVQRDGTIEEILPDTGRFIVGAGVSTCAPLIIQ